MPYVYSIFYNGKAYIDDLTLSPKKHSSLKQESIVGTQVHIGTKKAGAQTPAEKNYRPIYKWELEKTRDKLTKAELETVQAKMKNDTPEHRATHERTMQKWHDGFKVDSNKNNDLAVVKLTTSAKGKSIPGEKKSKYRPFVETIDEAGNPIKVSKKFIENPARNDLSKEA